MGFKQDLANALQNLSGKTASSTTSLRETLRSFNNNYACVVTFTLGTAASTIVVKRGTTVIAPEQDGTYILTEGIYTYTNSKARYTPKTDVALLITNTDEINGTKEVTTAALTTCVVTFTKDPETLTLVVKQGTVTLTAEQDGTYILPVGSYTYTASADAHVTQTDVALAIVAGDETTGTKTVAITLVDA